MRYAARMSDGDTYEIVDDMPEQALVEHVARVRRSIADSVAAMPRHQDFIDRHCRAPAG